MRYVPSWVASHLAYKDWRFSEPSKLWTLLGFPVDEVEALAHLQMRFENGCLFMAEAYASDDKVADIVVLYLRKIRQLREWACSRWLSIGPACRTLHAAPLSAPWSPWWSSAWPSQVCRHTS